MDGGSSTPLGDGDRITTPGTTEGGEGQSAPPLPQQQKQTVGRFVRAITGGSTTANSTRTTTTTGTASAAITKNRAFVLKKVTAVDATKANEKTDGQPIKDEATTDVTECNDATSEVPPPPPGASTSSSSG